MLPSIAAIMTEPDFGEVMFLVAFILFVILTVIHIVAHDVSLTLLTAALALLSLGWLAL